MLDAIIAPPLEIKVAASGTISTLYPNYVSSPAMLARAVVFPAQGPPVMRIRVSWMRKSDMRLRMAVDDD